MARRSYFVHFATALAIALFFVPAQAASIRNGTVDPASTLLSLSIEAQGHAINLVGP